MISEPNIVIKPIKTVENVFGRDIRCNNKKNTDIESSMYPPAKFESDKRYQQTLPFVTIPKLYDSSKNDRLDYTSTRQGKACTYNQVPEYYLNDWQTQQDPNVYKQYSNETSVDPRYSAQSTRYFTKSTRFDSF
jgi:hypothetical protein